MFQFSVGGPGHQAKGVAQDHEQFQADRQFRHGEGGAALAQKEYGDHEFRGEGHDV